MNSAGSKCFLCRILNIGIVTYYVITFTALATYFFWNLLTQNSCNSLKMLPTFFKERKHKLTSKLFSTYNFPLPVHYDGQLPFQLSLSLCQQNLSLWIFASSCIEMYLRPPCASEEARINDWIKVRQSGIKYYLSLGDQRIVDKNYIIRPRAEFEVNHFFYMW